jgi:hypothetical protein
MLVITLLFTSLTLSIPAGHSRPQSAGWRTYQGAWFEIKYPASFRVRPSLPSTSARGYDSVFFAATDGSVEFYVFSPQWNGTPSDIEVRPGEVLVSENVERKGTKSIRRVSIRAGDSSYLRAFEDTEDSTTNTRKVFGIKYRNQASYDHYRQIYLTFKASLRQFAD